MKNIIILFTSICLISFGCNDDHDELIYDYHAHIHAPDTTTKTVGDSLNIEIEFESHKGQIVHHINIRIYNKATLVEVYNKPVIAHVHNPVEFLYEDVIVLNNANGFTSNSTWILEAKVWGEKDGEEEEFESVEFRILP